MKTGDIIFRTAHAGDAGDVAGLYRSVLGSPGCTWNCNYPSVEEINADLAAGKLYVAVDANASDNVSGVGAHAAGKIAATVSVVPENELDELPFWHVRDKSAIEIARVAVAPGYRGRRLAAQITAYVLALPEYGDSPAVHLLVAKGNHPARRTYEHLGFNYVGECEMWGNDYFACELVREHTVTEQYIAR